MSVNPGDHFDKELDSWSLVYKLASLPIVALSKVLTNEHLEEGYNYEYLIHPDPLPA